MTPEQLTTVITNVLTGSGVSIFLFFVIRSLKREIAGLNQTVAAQKKTLEAMEKQVLETEKIGDIYRTFIDEFPQFIEKYKNFINQTRDDLMTELEQANDQKLKETRQLELRKLEIQDQIVSELPKLKEELVAAVHAFQERMTAMEIEHVMPLKWEIRNADTRADNLWLLPANRSHSDYFTFFALIKSLKSWKRGWEDQEKTKSDTPTTEDDESNESE
jgi:hypothetical protein